MMGKDKNSELFSGNHLSNEVLQKYIDRTLSPKELHEVEKYLLDNPFESDAIEGLELIKNKGDVNQIVTSLNHKISERAGVLPIESTYTQLKWISSIAASIICIVAVAWLFQSKWQEGDMMTSSNESLAYTEKTTSRQDITENATSPQAEELRNDDSFIKEEAKKRAVSSSSLDKQEEINQLEDEIAKENEVPLQKMQKAKDQEAERLAEHTQVNTPNKQDFTVESEAFSVEELADTENEELQSTFGSEADEILEEDVSIEEEPSIAAHIADNNHLARKKAQEPTIAKNESKEYPVDLGRENLDGYQLYSMERYLPAVRFFEDYLHKKPNDNTILYLSGISYLTLGKNTLAIDKLKQIKKRQFKEIDLTEIIHLVEKGETKQALQELNKYILINQKMVFRE